MDKGTKYRQLLKQILFKHLELVNRQPWPGVESELVIDEVHDNYIWIKIGWSGEERIDGITFFAAFATANSRSKKTGRKTGLPPS